MLGKSHTEHINASRFGWSGTVGGVDTKSLTQFANRLRVLAAIGGQAVRRVAIEMDSPTGMVAIDWSDCEKKDHSE